MQYRKLNSEVLISSDKYSLLDRDFIGTLKKMTDKSTRKRIRICIHKNDREIVQEMFIVHMKDAYVRPHKHLQKSESLQIIEGVADIIFFNDKGDVTKVIHMGDYVSGKTFYYKIDKPIYHSMIIKSKYLVFHEVTKGPFQRSESVFAPWAPADTEIDKVSKYTQFLKNDIKILNKI
jgi:cupin fold WbuC family metalloprotein